MNTAHHMVGLDQATPGMTLSDAILDKQGQVLLAQGTVLTASTLAALARHEVVMLPIAVAGEPAPPVDVAAVTARLAYIFRGDGSALDAGLFDTATALLHKYVLDHRLGHEVAP